MTAATGHIILAFFEEKGHAAGNNQSKKNEWGLKLDNFVDTVHLR